MGLNVKVGTIVQPGATGNQTYTLPANFDLKAIKLVCVAMAADGDSASSAVSGIVVGAGTYRGGTAERWYVHAFGESGDQTAVHAAAGSNTTRILKFFGPDADVDPPNVDLEVDLVSFSTGAGSSSHNEFTLNWVNLHSTASIIVGYIAYGGSDITDARATTFTTPAGTGNLDVTAFGFQPDLIFHATAGNANGDFGGTNADADTALMLGWAKSSTERFVSWQISNDAAASVELAMLQREKAVARCNSAGTLTYEADLTARGGWPATGAQYNFTTAVAGDVIYCLGLTGTFQAACGVATCPTAGPTPVTQDLAAGFAPLLGITAGNSLPNVPTTNISHANLGHLSLGAYDGTDEWCFGWSDDDANASQRGRNTMDRTKVLEVKGNAAGVMTTLDEADGSFSGTNFRLSHTTIDTTVAREFGWLALGAAAAAGTTHTITPTGATTPTGSLGKRASKPFSGASTPAGALGKTASKPFSGASVPAGALARLTGKRFGGSLAPAGTLATMVVRVLALAGSLTPAGSLAKRADKTLAGATTPAGGLLRTTGKALSGAATPAGALRKANTKGLAGSLTPTGALALAKVIVLALAGAISPAGAAARQTLKSLTGTSSPAGTLAKTVSKALAGTLAPAGALARLTGKLLGGAAAPAGTVTTGAAGLVAALLRLISRDHRAVASRARDHRALRSSAYDHPADSTRPSDH